MTQEEIVRRFSEWLDRTMAGEEPPRGIEAGILAAVVSEDQSASEDADRRCDSYALWAAMTALSQEVKLQGRAFKDLNDTMGSQAARIAEDLRAVYRDRERDLQREAERRARKEILGALIDLRDRLARGLDNARASHAETVRAASSTWLARFALRRMGDASAATLAALIKGYELGIERLDQTLEEFNAREVPCQGQPFDPRRMNAIDREETTAAPDGTVLEVYRSGYEWNGEVFRPAQVKVACAPLASWPLPAGPPERIENE